MCPRAAKLGLSPDRKLSNENSRPGDRLALLLLRNRREHRFAGAGGATLSPWLPATRLWPTVGTRVPAPYRWMENMQSAALHRWVAAENRLTDAYLAKIPVRRLDHTAADATVELSEGNDARQVAGSRIFFRRNAGLQNQSVLYVQDSSSAKPRILIDPNKLSPDGSVALVDFQPRLTAGISLTHCPRAGPTGKLCTSSTYRRAGRCRTPSTG